MPNHKTLGVDLSFFLLHNLARKLYIVMHIHKYINGDIG